MNAAPLMPKITPILECVPNFSEGRDILKINAIAAAIRAVPGIALLHIDISPAANRTVMTFAGAPEAVTEAAFQAIGKAAALIDMRSQEGVHPRIGVTDVCPLIPLYGLSMTDAVHCARQLGERVGEELGIPVYLYEYAATAAYRQALPDIRKGQYEGFPQKMQQDGWQPDFGPHRFTAASGATVIGARDILVAFNIGLDTEDVTIANQLAAQIRERGSLRQTENGKKRIPGLLSHVRAIGWYMADYKQAQVSFNLLDYRITSPLKVWETCRQLASAKGITLTGSEVIGLIPEACLIEAGSYAFNKAHLPLPDKQHEVADKAVAWLGLDRLKPFVLREKVLEYALTEAGMLPG